MVMTSCAGTMFVNGIPFVVTMSQKIRFCAAEVSENRSAKMTWKALNKKMSPHNGHRFAVRTALMDREFNVLWPQCTDGGVDLNTASTREHIPEIEHQIGMLKEWVMPLRNGLPFLAVPKVMVRVVAHFAVTWLDSFPVKDDVSELSLIHI